ncbi:S-adenosyl-L-methionine-dependent methyltransferase [Parathielavia appendiculata]|uniref:S-adenosyl-L-methionine-dependent methyltransferase n=1 Tax=Parathielavia appendiculata TaxID=2587402 RepID=A0AAN6TW25_9PEZI|nr:S-adenosyl-L-methionine-dependent methyltransferase [Parathielavia appendiculata]
MEEDGIIEPLEDDDLPEAAREVTSDYDPSEEETTFGSLTSSVNGHVWEYGRRYHAFRYGRYPIPNDEEEYKRESIRHTMLKDLLGGKLYLAPIGDSPQKIIDLGTGFGEWAIEVGETFPSAKVTGVDLSPIQPLWIPPNVEFIVDDIEDEWVHANDYDFAHFRFVNTLLKDNVAVLTRVFQNLKPGGWVEIQDVLPHVASDDNTIPPAYPLIKFYAMLKPVLRNKYGFDIRLMDRLPGLLQNVGFVNVQRKVFHMPLGEWARDPYLRLLGGYFREVMLDFVGAMASRPLVEAGYDREEIDDIVRDVHAAFANRRIHAYLPIHFVWAQKPPA